MKEMFDSFSHFLAFGVSDQRTLISLAGEYDGMIVPGTIAAYQSDPTRGFVLSLNAAEKLPYAIDSRFPLFQTHLPKPKPSHLLLAGILGLPEPPPGGRWLTEDSLRDEALEVIATNWIAFNGKFVDVQPEKFEKYAKRLKKALPQVEASGPRWILPPYLMKDADHPDAMEVSQRIWDLSTAAAETQGFRSRLRRVVAVQEASELSDAALASGESEVLVWVSNLDETRLENHDRLVAYGKSIISIHEQDVSPFALYGGFFAVMLRSVGLVGASHGVGQSEHRDHVELKTSGAAPPRFYVSRLHRYVPRDLASDLWRRNRDLIDSNYPGYVSRDPGEFDYHELMQHSVEARQHEIQESLDRTPQDYVGLLRSEQSSYLRDLESITLPSTLRKRIEDFTAHLGMWAHAMEQIST